MRLQPFEVGNEPAVQYRSSPDSPLEGTGFKLSVPREIGAPSVANTRSSQHVHAIRLDVAGNMVGVMKQISSLTVTGTRCSIFAVRTVHSRNGTWPPAQHRIAGM